MNGATSNAREDVATFSPEECVTDCLERWRDGDPKALQELMPLVYQDLRRLASSLFAAEREGHTLQATALLHDVYLELSREQARRIRSRGELFAFVATLMRRALVDHSRAKLAQKRGGRLQQVDADESAPAAITAPQQMLAVHEALERLHEFDPEAVELVELRFFAGFTLEEIAASQDKSLSTVTRRWRAVRALLRRLLAE